MPAKGTRKLTDRQKVEIVVQKGIKRKGTSTNVNLGKQFDVKPNTIAKTTYATLNEKQKELYEETVKKLKFSSLSLTANSIEKANELVGLAFEAKDLSGVVAAGKFGHDVYRLETGQSTQNTNDLTNSPESQCQRFVEDLLKVAFYVCDSCNAESDRGTLNCSRCDGLIIERRATLEQAYDALMHHEGIEESVKVRFVEAGRRMLK